MMKYFVSSTCGRSITGDRVSARRHTSPALAQLTRAASSGRLRRCVLALALALAGTLPLSGMAQRHWHRGGRNGGSGTGAALSGLTCSQSTLSGMASDACTVRLNAAAGSQGVTVSLSSSNTAFAVPASIVVPSGATTAAFTASASAVTASQSVTLTASGGGISETFVLTLNAAGAAALSVNSSSVAFGSVAQNTTATQSVILSNSGTAALTIQAATVAGKGFSTTGLSLPVTLSPKQSAMLMVQFDPTAAGAATGTVTISSNAASGGTVTIALSGTGAAGASSSYAVDLSWEAPGSSTDPVTGYNVYRSVGSGSYTRLNTSVNQPTSYTDSTGQSGTTYNYKVTSVDASGVESTDSNVYTATIP